MKAQIEDPDLQGLVIVGFGGGYMMTQRQDLNSLFIKANKRGLLMILISQSFPEEPIRREMTEIFLQCGIIPGSDITLPAAVAKVAVLLGQDLNHEEKVHQMTLNWEGEMS